jgi:DNA-binding NtrC family response regulator
LGVILTFKESVRVYKAELLASTLAATGGNRSAAARRLGLTRTHLCRLLRNLGVVGITKR